MRSFLILSAAALSLAGCAVVPVQPATAPVGPIVVAPTPTAPVIAPDSATRAAAVSIVNREMAARLPGVNVMPYTACVVNNATQAELTDLAATARNGSSAAGAVASIVKRPGASSCIANLSRTA